MKKFEPSIVNFVNVWYALTVVILSAAFNLEGPFPQWGYYWIAITLCLMLPQLAKFTVKKILIDRGKNVIIIEWRKWFFISKQEEYPISSVRAEMVNELNKRGRHHDVFRIFVNNQVLAELPSRFTGWKKEIANAFIVELIG